MAPDEDGSNGDGNELSPKEDLAGTGSGGEVIHGGFPARSVPSAGISNVSAQWEIHTTRDKLRLHLDYWDDYWEKRVDEVRAGSRAKALIGVALSLLSLGLGVLLTYAGASQFRDVGPLSKEWVETIAQILIIGPGLLAVVCIGLAIGALYRRHQTRRAIHTKGGPISQQGLLKGIERDIDPPF